MVMVIQNPAASGVDTTGQGIGQSLNSIASAFGSRQADISGQIAFQKYQDQQTAQKVLASQGANVADANQDYAQDQPDYVQGGAAAGETQPPMEINVENPDRVSRAFLALGLDPGKAMQNISALTGGIRSPGVALGATMDGTYAATPEGISNANNLAIQKDASAPILYQDRNGNTFYAPKNAPPAGAQPAPTGADQVKAQAERQYLFQPGNLQTQTAPVNPANPISVPGYNGTFTRA
jgi:hypothetical protein